MKTLRIGSGAGFADDRIEPARQLAEHGDYLVFECLAERTIALAQKDRRAHPEQGYNEWLEERMEAVLEACVRNGTRIITNMGAANPVAAAELVVRVADRLGIDRIRVAAVSGDDVLELVRGTALQFLERPDATVSTLGESLISANAYLGIEPVIEALRLGADVVITGRVADPSLFLAPLVHEFGWGRDAWDLLATGTAVGHLLECGAQVTGGYFADPGIKDVPDLENLGFPIAEVEEDGRFIVTKLDDAGGLVDVATVTEQLLYEVHDPARYVTPDVVADFSGARLEVVGDNRVSVSNIFGAPKPSDLKVSVGYFDSFIGEGQISYAGINALGRATLALDVVRARLEASELVISESRFEIVGVDSIHRGAGIVERGSPSEARIRVVARTDDEATARRVGREVTALWLNGPAGGAGAVRTVTEDIAIVSVLLDRDRISAGAKLVGARS
jgi:hypothetical protein